jgi:hypothetical protein
VAPPELYSGDLLENVAAFLFPKDNAGCAYLKVPDRFRNSWFRSGIRMQTAKGKAIASAVSCEGTEILLSPYGAGVLSITLEPSLPAVDGFDQVKEFNYRGSQLPRGSQLHGGNVALFSIPHPSEDKGRAEKLSGEVRSAPAPDAGISERLGAAGGVFTLGELRDFLIGPLRKLASWREPQANQFSVYTVVRFGKETEFEADEVRHELGPFLAGLAQIEEARHAGAPRGRIRVANNVLNAKHWAAVSTLGAAHLIADQGVPFDAQRLQIVRDRYFMPFLLAYLQRLTALRVIHDAQDAAERSDTTLGDLRADMLRFMVSSYFPDVSNRDALNSFYDLARQGLRVPESLEIAKGAIADLHAANEERRGRELNERLGQNMDIVADVQTKVEWLEIFFVSFYAAELSHIFAELWGFDHGYAAVTVPLCATVALLIAARFLRPWHRKQLSKRALILVSLFALLWFVAGWLWPKSPSEPAPAVPHGEVSSEHASPEGRSP